MVLMRSEYHVQRAWRAPGVSAVTGQAFWGYQGYLPPVFKNFFRRANARPARCVPDSIATPMQTLRLTFACRGLLGIAAPLTEFSDRTLLKDTTMATVDYQNGCRNDYDGDDEVDDLLDDPIAVADPEHSDAARAAVEGGAEGFRSTNRRQRQLHRIAEVRRLQGVTLRNVSRRLGASLAVVRRQEEPDCDLRVSDLLQWQEVLEVPIAELLVESEGQLSGPVLERSRMVKLMKTAAALREQNHDINTGRMVTMLIDQILELMPELADVTPWHTVGQRRTLDDVGRTGRCTISEEVFRKPLRD